MGKGFEKSAETVGKVVEIGNMLLKPRQMKKQADSIAYTMDVIGAAQLRNPNVNMSIEEGEIAVSTITNNNTDIELICELTKEQIDLAYDGFNKMLLDCVEEQSRISATWKKAEVLLEGLTEDELTVPNKRWLNSVGNCIKKEDVMKYTNYMLKLWPVKLKNLNLIHLEHLKF